MTIGNSKSVFQTLSEVNITPYLKDKNKLKYLPWSSAWEITKLNYPDAKYNIVKTADGGIYHTDGKTCWVETEVTIDGFTQGESLAVMNYRNQSITYDDVTSVDFENSIKRCLTKNLALFGLGLSLWVGEELSEAAKVKKKEIEEEEQATIKNLQSEAVSIAKKLIDSGIDSKDIYAEIQRVGGKKNPNSIKDIDKCQAVVDMLKEMGSGNKDGK